MNSDPKPKRPVKELYLDGKLQTPAAPDAAATPAPSPEPAAAPEPEAPPKALKPARKNSDDGK